MRKKECGVVHQEQQTRRSGACARYGGGTSRGFLAVGGARRRAVVCRCTCATTCRVIMRQPLPYLLVTLSHDLKAEVLLDTFATTRCAFSQLHTPVVGCA